MSTVFASLILAATSLQPLATGAIEESHSAAQDAPLFEVCGVMENDRIEPFKTVFVGEGCGRLARRLRVVLRRRLI